MERRGETDTGVFDEVARQRQKRSAARRDQPVGGTTEVTIGELADQAAAAAGADADAVTRYLQGGGHSRTTIENVIRCLGLDGSAEAARTGPVETHAHLSRGQDRLRTVAQLEALLLKD